MSTPATERAANVIIHRKIGNCVPPFCLKKAKGWNIALVTIKYEWVGSPWVILVTRFLHRTWSQSRRSGNNPARDTKYLIGMKTKAERGNMIRRMQRMDSLVGDEERLQFTFKKASQRQFTLFSWSAALVFFFFAKMCSRQSSRFVLL